MEQESGFRIGRAQTRLAFLYGESYLVTAACRHAGGWQGEYYLLMQNPLRHMEKDVIGFRAGDLRGDPRGNARGPLSFILDQVGRAAHQKFSALSNDAGVQFVEAGQGDLAQLWMRNLYPQEWNEIGRTTRCGKLAAFITAMERLPIVV
jgi:hypothetical protein